MRESHFSRFSSATAFSGRGSYDHLAVAMSVSDRSTYVQYVHYFLRIFYVFDITNLMGSCFLWFYELSNVLVVLWLYGSSSLFITSVKRKESI
jgi:hypothetical protein